MSQTITIFHVPAGYPLSGILKLQKKASTESQYTDVTSSASIVPADDSWYLNFVDDNNKARLSIPLDWSTLSQDNPWVPILLTGEQTLSVKGKVLHLEISNSAGVSDLITPPSEYFDFVPNKIPPLTMTVQTVS